MFVSGSQVYNYFITLNITESILQNHYYNIALTVNFCAFVTKFNKKNISSIM